MDSSGSGWVPVGGICEYDIEPMTSIKAGNFLTNRTTVLFSSQTWNRGISISCAKRIKVEAIWAS
jgi:hypothetical protein